MKLVILGSEKAHYEIDGKVFDGHSFYFARKTENGYIPIKIKGKSKPWFCKDIGLVDKLVKYTMKEIDVFFDSFGNVDKSSFENLR